MTSSSSFAPDRPQADGEAVANQAGQNGMDGVIKAEVSSQWMSADELRKHVLRLLADGKNPVFDLEGLCYLDASALQVLLASQVESERLGREMRLANVSAELLKWFELGSAADQFTYENPGNR